MRNVLFVGTFALKHMKISFLANNFKQFSEDFVWPSDTEFSEGVKFDDAYL